MRFEVINETTISTRRLEILVRACAERLERGRWIRNSRKKATVRFKFMRPGAGRKSSGGAVLGGQYMVVRIGEDCFLDNCLGWSNSYTRCWNPARVARTISHELMHIGGRRHRQMPHWVKAHGNKSENNLVLWQWALTCI